MRLKEPFVIASQRIEICEHVICYIDADEGHGGVGSVATIPAFMWETASTIRAAIAFLAPLLVGKDPCNVENVCALMDAAFPGNHSAKAAIDLACHDLLGVSLGRSVGELLGGCSRGRIPCTYILGLKDTAETLAEGIDKFRSGYSTLKVKIGRDERGDFEKLRLLRSELGPDAVIRVDANCAYTYDTAIRVLSRMEKLDLEMIEQPCRPADIKGMARLCRALKTPILADESVMTPEDALRVVCEGAADIINIKVGKVGGIVKAVRIAAIADAASVPIVMSGNLELGHGIAASAHVAASLFGAVYATDIFVGAHKHDSDLIRQDWGEQGMTIRVPDGPGLGVSLREEFAVPAEWHADGI